MVEVSWAEADKECVLPKYAFMKAYFGSTHSLSYLWGDVFCSDTSAQATHPYCSSTLSIPV